MIGFIVFIITAVGSQENKLYYLNYCFELWQLRGQQTECGNEGGEEYAETGS